MNITRLRERMEELRATAERSKGRRATLEERKQEAIEELRSILGCEPGDEKQAIKELKEQVEKYERDAGALIEKAERKMRKL